MTLKQAPDQFKQLVCMDKFIEMIEIEQEFGPIDLGHTDPVPQRKPEKPKRTMDCFGNPIDQSEPSLWGFLLKNIDTTPAKFKKFIDLIH